ncbi:hypothetical protein HDU93_009486 [Gonapodya sp. JEL0774]|nr:hypothetical protein HDU93_009486 [Gonapodya sp. JEL0774]
MSSGIPIGGFVAPGYEPVLSQFKRNFEIGRELGASYSAYVRGQLVVDLWGGWADSSKTKPWNKDSLTVVYSCGKAVQGMIVAHLVSRNLIGYDDPVAKYWPEFAQGGKENVTIRDICQHAAGLSFLDDDNLISLDDVGDLKLVAEKLARQPHSHAGHKTKVYHATTQGWCLNELFRRVMGKTHGQFLREVVNPGLGVDVYSGFDVDDPAMESRYAQVVPSAAFLKAATVEPPPPGSLKWRVARSGPPRPQANDHRVRRHEIPSAFTVTNARSLARIAALCSMGGALFDFELIDRSTLLASIEVDQSMDGVVDLFTGFPTRTCRGGASWARNLDGYKVPTIVPRQQAEWRGPGWEWTGWMGTGGSHIQWDVKNQVSSAYVMNLLEPGFDNRGMSLVGALVNCVEELRKKGGRVNSSL